MSFLPTQNPKTNYGMFGYSGAMCDMAIRQDDPDMLRECIANGWIDADTPMTMSRTVLAFCEARGYKRCAEVLRASKVPA